jgi:hypothetical protein
VSSRVAQLALGSNSSYNLVEKGPRDPLVHCMCPHAGFFQVTSEVGMNVWGEVHLTLVKWPLWIESRTGHALGFRGA